MMIDELVTEFFQVPENNRIFSAEALNERLKGMRIFSTPLVGYADPDDPLFRRFAEDPVICAGRFKPPREWLGSAGTVVSIFLPFTEQVRQSNTVSAGDPSPEWLHGRIEGQKIIDRLSVHLRDSLTAAGARTVVPGIEAGFFSINGTALVLDRELNNADFGSNWSERHVAFAAGLGTFGLSRGLITEKGMAGRFTSLVSELMHEPMERQYSRVYEYCLQCGACANNCPVAAISVTEGKDHGRCARFLNRIKERHFPRYGCGKCQVAVPCESAIPRKAASL